MVNLKYILLLSILFICSCRTTEETQYLKHMKAREKLIIKYTDSAIDAFIRGDTLLADHWFGVAFNVDSILKVKHK